MEGIVKSFNAEKGYGFIKSKEFDEDIFFHYSEIIMDGFKKLNIGDKVKFIFDKAKVRAEKVEKINK